MLARSGEELLKICEEENISLSEYAIRVEMEDKGLSREEVYEKMAKNLKVMKDGATEGREKEVYSLSGLIGGDGYRIQKYLEKGSTLTGDVTVKAMAMALSSSEVNAGMGRIVACPTAGSCGILPAVILSAGEKLGKTDEELIMDFRGGDTAIMDYLLEKYKPMVKKKAKAMYLLGGDSDDLIQEGMIGLFKAVRDYDSAQEASFGTFAQICVTRQLYSAIRASRRKKHLPLNSYISLYDNEEISEEKESELIQIQNIASTNNPEDLVIHKESEDSFMNELEGNLSELERKVLYLHLLGTDYRTIAKLLGKSPKAVDNALQRIKTKAEELLTSI